MLAAGELAGTDLERGTLTLAELDALASAAITQWTQALGAADSRLAGLADVRISIGNLAGNALGYYDGASIVIDDDAAGHGWFVDLTPADAVEFAVQYDPGTLRAAEGSEAFGRVDLLTVLMHELGHAIGFADNEAGRAVMDEDLEPGARYLLELGLDGDPEQPRVPAFDLGFGPAPSPASARIQWDADPAAPWSADYSPYAAPKRASTFSDYVLKLSGEEDAGFDKLGKDLLGAKTAARKR
jgi:hypothetical protein